MKIVNRSKQFILAENVTCADTPFKRLKGLLGRKSLNQGEALIITPANSIHTFFMRFPIDALFVDKHNRVVKALSSLKPYRLSPICWRGKFVIELPAGTIQSTSTSSGDILEY